MKTIQVYDPPMCCSTGVCGNIIDPALIRFSSLLKQLSEKGVTVERYNLSHQPMAFVQNSLVKELIAREGIEVLPLVFVDGQLRTKGKYLTESDPAEPLASSSSSLRPEGRP